MAAMPSVYRSLSRKPTVISEKMWEQLARYRWRVHPNDDATRDTVAELLLKENLSTKLFPTLHNSKMVDCFSVPLEIVKHLTENEKSAPYSFDAYRRPSDSVPWRLWLKGEKAVGPILGARFVGRHPTPLVEKKSA